MPKVSVIIPLYNGERFIRDALESVLSQTFQDFEMIVVDDGSTDRGKDIVLDMKGPITYVYQENSGTAAARNQGVLNSRGEYIAFLDQDDRWYPQKLETQIRQLDDNPQIGIVYSDIDLIDDVENILEHGHLRNLKEPSKEVGLLRMFPEYPRPDAYPSAVLMRREIFLRSGMFDPGFKRNCFEDVDLWFRIVRKKLGRFFFYPEPLIQIRRHPLQGGRNKQAMEENWLLLAKKLLELYSDDPRISALRLKLAQMFSHKGKYLIRDGDIKQGRKYFNRAFNCYPLYWKNLRRLALSYFRVAQGKPGGTLGP